MLVRNFLFSLFFCALAQAGVNIDAKVETMQKDLTYKARTDQYTLATDIRPR